MPASTKAADSHVFFSTPFLIINKITGSITTVIERVNAPVETSKNFKPYRYRSLYMQFSAESNSMRSSSFFPPRLTSATTRLKKQRKSSDAPIRFVIVVVANGTMLSGMHAYMMTSVDHKSVTHIRHIFACSLFIPILSPPNKIYSIISQKPPDCKTVTLSPHFQNA